MEDKTIVNDLEEQRDEIRYNNDGNIVNIKSGDYWPDEISIPEEISILSDVIYLSKIMSKHFHEKSITPDYYITGFSNHGQVWNIVEMEDPVKDIQHFLPNCRLNEKMKKNIYWKAERAGQSILLCQMLSNYFHNKIRSNALFYNKCPIINVFILPITTKYHKTPVFDDERKVLSGKETFHVIHLHYIDEERYVRDLYIDLCSPQVDVTSYDSEGYPLYVFENLEVDELYANEHNRDTTVIRIDQDIYVNSDVSYQNYLDAVRNEFMDEVEEYVRHLYNSYKDTIRKKLRNKRRNKNRR